MSLTMAGSSVGVVLTAILAAHSVAAQQCPVGPADATSRTASMMLEWAPADVAREVPNALRAFGYRVVRADSGDRRFVTGVNRRRTDEFPMIVFRDYPHPGIALTVTLEPAGDSTRLTVSARAECAVGRAPPTGYAGPVEDTFEEFALGQAGFGILHHLRSRPGLRPLPPSQTLPDSAGPYDTLSVDQVPQLSRGSCAGFRYPAVLQQEGVEGRVVVQFVVDTLGRAEPASLRVLWADHPDFVATARRVVLSCQYTPGRIRNRPVRVRVTKPINFTIEPGGGRGR